MFAIPTSPHFPSYNVSGEVPAIYIETPLGAVNVTSSFSSFLLSCMRFPKHSDPEIIFTGEFTKLDTQILYSLLGTDLEKGLEIKFFLHFDHPQLKNIAGSSFFKVSQSITTYNADPIIPGNKTTG